MKRIYVGNNDIIGVGAPFYTTSNIDLYVDNINGDDANIGTVEYPLKTIIEAESRLPLVIGHVVTIRLLPYDNDVPNTGSYVWPVFRARILMAPIFIIGESYNIISSGAAQSGSDKTLLVTTGTFSNDELVDEPTSIRITSGAASGDHRSICENNSTDLTPATVFTEVVSAGDTYELIRPVVRVSVPVQSNTYRKLCSQQLGVDNNDTGKLNSINIINMFMELGEEVFASTWAGLETQGLTSFFGVVLNGGIPASPAVTLISNSSVLAGAEQGHIDFPRLRVPTLAQYLPSLAVNETALVGWGLHAYNTFGLGTTGQGFNGYIVTKSSIVVGPTAGASSDLVKVQVRLRGGRCSALMVGTPRIEGGTSCIVRQTGGSTTMPHVDFKIRPTTFFGVINFNSNVLLSHVDFGTAGQNDCIQTHGPAGKTHIYRCSGSVSGIGMVTFSGAIIYMEDDSPITGATGDFSEDGGVTLRPISTLLPDTHFIDAVRHSRIFR